MPARFKKVSTLLISLLLMLMAVVTAGCLGGTDASDSDLDDAGDDTGEEQPNDNATLPGGRGESSGLKETNRTEEGVGGSAHMHDYWRGRSQVVIFEGDVDLFPFPVFPDGEGSNAKSAGYVKPPAPNLVFEGTERVTVEIFDPRTGFETIPHPLSPPVHLQYRTAMDSEWRESVELSYEEPLTIDVDPLEADMPHSTHSLWVFRLTTESPEDLTIGMRVTVHRGHDVEDWPGHPDFYAETSTRVVMDESVRTHMSGIREGWLYDGGGTWVHPERLISWGTTHLDVFVNVTGMQSEVGAEATGYFLEYHNATVVGPEIRFGERVRDSSEDEDIRTLHFQIEVDPQGMDSPYQPESRWGFRVMATFANAAGVGLCPGCFGYEIEYDITILAHGGEMDHEMM